MSESRPTASPFVRLDGALFGYEGRAVVRAAALALERGRCTGVFGPNGSGKTTLVRGLTGLLQPLAGRAGRAAGLRYGYVPQYRGVDLLWPMSGFDAASLAAAARGPFGWLGGEARRRIRESMERLGVADLASSSFGTLSGGQQQRLLLAGALATSPDVLVLDEPTDGLDVASRARLLELLRGLMGEGLCAVLISHDVEDLLATSHQVAWLHAAVRPGEASEVEAIEPAAMAARVLAAGGRR